MRGIAKTVIVVIAAILGTALLAVTTTFTAAVTLSATTALIVPGTGTPKPAEVPNYLENANGHYLVPAGECSTVPADCNVVGIPYYAQFWPIPLPGWGGLSGQKWNVSVQSGVTGVTTAYNDALVADPNGKITVFGYSQGATVANILKGNLVNTSNKDNLNFFFIGDPQRPNGGFFERFAILGTVPILDATFGVPSPTNTCGHTDGTPCATDFALQYDGVADFPEYPINGLATLNALAGFEYIHGTYLAPDDGEAVTVTPYGYTVQEVQDAVAAATALNGCTPANYCQRHGDTIYVTLPARTLPIMQPALDLGAATGTSVLVIPVVDLISPFTQTLIETGYDRTDYGAPTPLRIIPRINPITLTTDLIKDVPEGIHAALNPGLDPLPGSEVPAPDSSTVTTLAEPPAPTTTRRTLTPVNLFAKPDLVLATAKPGQPALTNPFGTKVFGTGTTVHPIRDSATAVAGAVSGVVNGAMNGAKKVLGVKVGGDNANSNAGAGANTG
jgi:hypothetical protein